MNAGPGRLVTIYEPGATTNDVRPLDDHAQRFATSSCFIVRNPASDAEVCRPFARTYLLFGGMAFANHAAIAVDDEGFKSQRGTTHYGHFLLAGLLFDRIEESTGRIVGMANLGHNMAS